MLLVGGIIHQIAGKFLGREDSKKLDITFLRIYMNLQI